MARYGYCFTFNHKDDEPESVIQTKYNELQGAIGVCGVTYITFGRERGGQAQRLHLQGYLQSNQKNKSRFTERLGIYVTPQERTATQARDYCQKDGDFWQGGVFCDSIKGTKEKKQGSRSDLEGVKHAIEQGQSYDEICASHFETVAKYSRFIEERIQARDSGKELSLSLQEYENVVWRPWQQDVIRLAEAIPDPRKIHWIWEETGNVGKSYLAKYLAAKYKACLLKPGKQADLAYIISKTTTNLVIFDLSRTNAPSEGREHFLDSAYSLAEDLKNGAIQSTKYNSTSIIKRTSTVIFFANFPPDLSKWSGDRYAVTQLN